MVKPKAAVHNTEISLIRHNRWYLGLSKDASVKKKSDMVILANINLGTIKRGGPYQSLINPEIIRSIKANREIFCNAWEIDIPKSMSSSSSSAYGRNQAAPLVLAKTRTPMR